MNNPTFGNGFGFAESVGSLLYWPFGIVDSYAHFGIDVVTPDVRRHQFEMLDRIDNGTFSPWDYRNIYPNYYAPYFLKFKIMMYECPGSTHLIFE